MVRRVDKNLQRFYNSFTQSLQIAGIMIFDCHLNNAENPTKANSERSEGVPNFRDSDPGVGAKPRVLLR